MARVVRVPKIVEGSGITGSGVPVAVTFPVIRSPLKSETTSRLTTPPLEVRGLTNERLRESESLLQSIAITGVSNGVIASAAVKVVPLTVISLEIRLGGLPDSLSMVKLPLIVIEELTNPLFKTQFSAWAD